MSHSEKIEALTEMMVDTVVATLHQTLTEAVATASEIPYFKDHLPFIAALAANSESDTTSFQSAFPAMVSAAAVSDLLFTVQQAILADDEVSEDELLIAMHLLEDVIYRYAWMPEYSRFDPLVDPTEVRDLIVTWNNDRRPFGGDFNDGAVALPFATLSVLSAITSGDRSVHDLYVQSTTLISRMIVADGGVSAAETQWLGDLKQLRDKERQIIDAAIHSRTASRGATSTTSNRTVAKGSPSSDTPQHILETALIELDQLIGVPEVKAEVRKLTNFLKVRQQRQAAGLPLPSQSLHFVFTGNPGTGKTTVARIISRILYGFEILDTPTFIESDRSMLVGGYLGQTAIKTAEVIDSAVNGVLFIDEAYTLSRNEAQDSFGQEAIDTLLKRMEDLRDRLVVIAAGYPRLMRDFLATNPGLESRFTRFIHFSDYHVSDLCRILETMCASHSYRLTPHTRAHMAILFNRAYAKKDEKFGNARFVRNVYEKTLGNHADRLAGIVSPITRDMLSTIEAEDVPMDMAIGLHSPYDVSGTTWSVTCPGCTKTRTVGVTLIGNRVTCKCGTSFRCPWWNLNPETLPSLSGFKKHDRPEDLLGYDAKIPPR